MILGIGIDTIATDRFESWSTLPHSSLQRIFSDQEITYCLSAKNPTQHFAARFAAREALLKALSPLCAKKLSLLTIAKSSRISKLPNGAPQLLVEWEKLPELLVPPTTLVIHLSLSHTKESATALVIVEQL